MIGVGVGPEADVKRRQPAWWTARRKRRTSLVVAVQPSWTVTRRPSASTKAATSTALARPCSLSLAPGWPLTAAAARCRSSRSATGCPATVGGGLHRLARPAGELAGERAGHRAEIGDRRADLEQLDRAQGVQPPESAVGQRPVADPLAGQVGMALQRIGAVALGPGRRLGARRRAPLLAARDARVQRDQRRQSQSPPHAARMGAKPPPGQAARIGTWPCRIRAWSPRG